MNTLHNVLAVIGFFGAVVFVATYAAVPWWRSREGFNVMVVSVSVAGLFGLRCLTMIFGDGYWGQPVLRALLFVAIGGAMWHRWWRLLKAQIATAIPAEPKEP